MSRRTLSVRAALRALNGVSVALAFGCGPLLGVFENACAAPAAAGASAPAPMPGERERIREGRASAEARLLDRERECQERFVVTSCVDAAKRDYRDVLSALQARQRVLDEEDRKRNAAQRLESTDEKAAGADAAPAEAEHAERPRRQPAAPVFEVRPPASPGAARGAGSDLIFGASPKPASERRADEARSLGDFEARKKAADAHREAVERRNADRAAKTPPLAPLPVPAAALRAASSP